MRHASDQQRNRHLAVSTALFSLATALSRVIGLIREIVAAALLGTRGAASVFTVANNVPNTVRSLVADAALGASFVPVFNELLERGEERRAWRVASTVLCVSTVVLSAVSLTGMLLARPILSLSNLHGHDLDLAVTLARILFPIVLLLGLAGIFNAILNSFHEFFVPAIAPVAWNVVIVGFLIAAFLVTDNRDTQVVLYAVGTLVGTVVQLVLPLPWLRGRGGRLEILFDVRDEAVRRVFVLMLPVAIGLGLINLNLLVDTFFASYASDAAARSIELAFRVYMLPQGVFSVAVAAVLFPTLARLAAAGDLPGFRTQITSGVRQIAFLLLPSSVICAVLCQPIVRLLFQHGSLTADQTPVVADALAAFSLGLAANGVALLLTRGFFSLQRPWLPTIVAFANLALNSLLDWQLLRLGAWGIPLATSIVNLVTIIVLWVALAQLVGSLDLAATASVLGRVGVCCVLLGGVAWGGWYLLDNALGRAVPAQVVSLAVPIAVAVLAYYYASILLGVQEARLVRSLIGRRFGRSAT
jgi:putative peptidoglycan lipid II flippase